MRKFMIIMLSRFSILTSAKTLGYIYDNIICLVKTAKIRAQWRNFNKHNHTFVANTIYDKYFPLNKVTVGKHTYGPLCVHSYDTVGEQLKIGNYCSFSIGAKFILGGNHSLNTFSTFPFRYFFNNGEHETWTKGAIVVEDDVWIGTDAIILSGVTLGKGTVVAAGSVVTKSTPPYSIIGGNPAKLIKMRFDDALIEMLIYIDFEKIDEKKFSTLLPKLYLPLDEKILLEIKNELFG